MGANSATSAHSRSLIMEKRHSYLLCNKREVGQRLSNRSARPGLNMQKKETPIGYLFLQSQNVRGRSIATTGVELRLRTVRARQGLNIQKRGHPHWISSHLEHETGFEPATLALARRYSTTEPLVHTYLQNHILKSIFTVSSTNQTFLDKPSTD